MAVNGGEPARVSDLALVAARMASVETVWTGESSDLTLEKVKDYKLCFAFVGTGGSEADQTFIFVPGFKISAYTGGLGSDVYRFSYDGDSYMGASGSGSVMNLKILRIVGIK